MDSNGIKSRMGRFYISQSDMRENPERFLPMFQNIVVIDATTSFAYDRIEYTGLSWYFEPLEPGSVVPVYDIELMEDFTPATPTSLAKTEYSIANVTKK